MVTHENNPFLITMDLVASEHWGTGHRPRPPAPQKQNKTIHLMKLTLRKNLPSLVTCCYVQQAMPLSHCTSCSQAVNNTLLVKNI